MYFNYGSVCGSCGFGSCYGCGYGCIHSTHCGCNGYYGYENKYSVIDDLIFLLLRNTIEHCFLFSFSKIYSALITFNPDSSPLEKNDSSGENSICLQSTC
ncbi:keratin-associated protein 21-3 [Gorilla gorilla gorilla]|uniref:keratin-associated protein 21-3 n=1 Tax=Gorilla gorilla gorilla TaxID=9595 RepID=UPI002446111E|nr:keratin-associated protein 21-3 [Gorilla gorilla gorilla]